MTSTQYYQPLNTEQLKGQNILYIENTVTTYVGYLQVNYSVFIWTTIYYVTFIIVMVFSVAVEFVHKFVAANHKPSLN